MSKKHRKLISGLSIVLSITFAGAGLISRAEDANSGNEPVLRGKHVIAQNLVVDPNKVYERVWDLISNEFYDRSFNNQDWERWHHRYDGKLKTIDDAHKAIETALCSLGDKYTRFLDRDAFSEEKQAIDAHLFGVGIQIGMDKSQRIIVIAPIEDSPASHAGVQAGDQIAEVNGKSTSGFSVDEAAKAIKGEKDTEVELTLMRKGERLKVKMIRDEIRISAIPTGSAKMLDSEVGYIRLSSFISKKADEEVKKALKNLAGAKGLVLDLRDNPGGLLTNAIEIANMFLDGKNNIVYTVDADGYKTPAVSDGKTVTHQPLVVLINKGSASASEIASGALKDNGRAILVGTRTFGKGLVQGISRLQDESGINYTIARYLTPSDADINNKGISPDITVELTSADYERGNGPWWIDDGRNLPRKPEDLNDLQLKKAVEYLKAHFNDKVVLGKADTNATRGN
jgi:carboxyl-terminal processing protease